MSDRDRPKDWPLSGPIDERESFGDDLITGDATIDDGHPEPIRVAREISSVTDVADRAADAVEAIDPRMGRAARAIARVVVQHMHTDRMRDANEALRQAASPTSDSDCAERLAALEAWRAGLTGVDERNGRLGRLESDVRSYKKRFLWAASMLAALAVTVAGSGFVIVDKMKARAHEDGRVEEWRRNVERSIDSLTVAIWRTGLYPPVPPAKDSP